LPRADQDPCGACTPCGHRDPGRQRRGAHRLAGGDVGADRFGDLGPAGCLPGFEGALLPAEAPAHGEIDVARVVGNVFQMHGTVMEHVAEDRPEKLRLRMRRGAAAANFSAGFFILRIAATSSATAPAEGR
jgi:hypothetical protein